MPDINPTREQNWFWTSFIFVLFLPLMGSLLSPQTFYLFVPVIGVFYFLVHKVIFRTWPFFKAPLPGLIQLISFLIALMAASALWSVNPEASFERSLKISGLIVASFALLGVAQSCPSAIWRKYATLFPFAIFALGFIMSFNIYLDGALNASDVQPDSFNKNVSIFVMILPIALYLSWKSRSILSFCALLLLTLTVFTLTSSQACQLAILIILIGAFGCLSFLEKITLRAAFLGISFLIVMMPWISPTLFDLLAAKVGGQKSGLLAEAATASRLEIWDFLSRRILENPLTGFGLDATAYMKFDTQQLYFHDNHISHPHNLGLQIWIEFGLMGIAWAIAFLGYLYACLMKMDSRSRRLSFLTFCAVTVFLLGSWSVWASWLMAFSFYLATLCVLAAKTNNDPLNS